MLNRLLLGLCIVGCSLGQLVDDFQCPDEFEGFYPHLISCDKYWYCKENVATLKTCGNGLGFVDTDETFTLEQCEELPLVECGLRTEIEPAISTSHCPRLYGTFADPESCSVFWKCLDGKANRYECPPGLAYDQVSRGCKWADQVPECKRVLLAVDSEDGQPEEFKCPAHSAIGTFTKHAHPADCRQYFVCIAGVPREYGCPLGTVFKIGGDEFSGKCTEPEEVEECRNYYGDIEFDEVELSRAGADTGIIRDPERVRSNVGAHNFRQRPETNAIPESTLAKVENAASRRRPVVPVQSAPASPADVDEPVVAEVANARPQRPRPVKPRPVPTTQRTTTTTESQPTTPSFSQADRFEPVSQTERPASRFQVLTDRPVGFAPLNLAGQQPFAPAAAAPAPVEESPRPFTAFNSPPVASEAAPTLPPSVVTLSPDNVGLPDPAPAEPGPNGEEYYYYYYYEDEEPVANNE